MAFEARRVVHPVLQTDARAAAVAAQGLLARVLHAGAVHWVMPVVAAAEAANAIRGREQFNIGGGGAMMMPY